VTFPGRPGPIPGRGTFYCITLEIAVPKKSKKPRKRGPKEERLVIREEPEAALARLLKPAKPNK
jgi:hypothetical protein